MNLFTAFAQVAGERPSKPALFWGETEFTYGDFLRQSLELAARLQSEFGLQPGDRVGLWMKNCPEFVTALFGVLAAGGVAVPINNFLKADEVSFILSDAGVRVLISQPVFSDSFERFNQSCPGIGFIMTEDLGRPSGVAAPAGPPNGASRSTTDLAVIVYTSGTTGQPKGAMLSHGNLLSNIESCRQVLAAIQEDRFVLLLPMFHSFMLTVGILLPLLIGGSIVLIKSLHPPKNVLQEIIHRQATLLPAIPQFFRTLLEAPSLPPLPLRLCISGAAPLPVQTLNEFSSKMPVPLIEGYGLSEASPVVSMNPLEGTRKPGSIGLPVPNVEVSVQDDAGNHLPDGKPGEICVRGPNVMQGYWNRPEETCQSIRNGWLLTGDIGFRDPEGYFFITDRKKDMLLVNGINVYPREIEEILYQFPGVKEAAVVGVPDPRRGEQPVAFVAAADGVALDEKSLLHHLRARLADYKVPRRIRFLDALPRNATGKILKTALRTLAAG